MLMSVQGYTHDNVDKTTLSTVDYLGVGLLYVILDKVQDGRPNLNLWNNL